MRPSSILMAVLFLTLLLIGLRPHLEHAQAATSEVFPMASLQPPTQTEPGISPSVTLRPVFPGLGEFIQKVINGNPNDVVGVFATGHFALGVVKQPPDQPAYVSSDANLLTQFLLPAQYGTIGLLAHNFLSGKKFYNLKLGDEVVVVYGDGRSDLYRIDKTEDYQALNPSSPYSDFIDLRDRSQSIMTSANLFNHIYTQPNRLVFQTCIDEDGQPSWGRLFVSGSKVSSIKISLPAVPTPTNN